MTAHAKLSASGSSKWLNCPGSVQAEEKYPPQGSSIFALEGTMAHEVADLCLKNTADADFYVGHTVLKKVVEKDMAAYVQEYLDYVRSFEGNNTALMTEERVSFDHVVPVISANISQRARYFVGSSSLSISIVSNLVSSLIFILINYLSTIINPFFHHIE